ncbi:MAG: ABC transporter permease subunit [Candidatus Pacebacteria bacterium]|jgi:ABC-2 type transport system permease protein|nr:ABC transporter permease subunit [Candidatus Paceibacterota bacterium]
MNRTITLAKKEINSYFNSPLGYLVASVFLVASGWLFMQGFFISGQATMRGFFALMPAILIFILPAVTMSSWAEEKRSGTAEVLLTLPLENIQVVLGKFLAAFVFLVKLLFFTFMIPLMLGSLSEPDWGLIFAGYLGTLFLGAAYIAIGLWVSSVTKNQITAFLLSLVVIFLFYIVGSSFVLDTAPSIIAIVGKNISLATHFNSILRGVISLKDLVYYFSVVIFFLFLNTQAIKERKWK